MKDTTNVGTGSARGMKLLFVCTKNRLRSPTAEHHFSQFDGVVAMSAGTSKDADTRLTKELVSWADIVFCMEAAHVARVNRRFRTSLARDVVCLSIPDRYGYLDKALIAILERKVIPHLRRNPSVSRQESDLGQGGSS